MKLTVSLRFNAYLSEADSDWKAQDQYKVTQFVHNTCTGEGKMRVNGYLLGKYSASPQLLKNKLQTSWKFLKYIAFKLLKITCLAVVGLKQKAKN